MEHGPFSSMIDLFKMVIFQFALLVYHRVYANKSPISVAASHVNRSLANKYVVMAVAAASTSSNREIAGKIAETPWGLLGNLWNISGKSVGNRPNRLGNHPPKDNGRPMMSYLQDGSPQLCLLV